MENAENCALVFAFSDKPLEWVVGCSTSTTFRTGGQQQENGRNSRKNSFLLRKAPNP